MYPPEPNTKAEASPDDSRTSKFKTRFTTSGARDGPSTDSSYQSSNPSAPLLPSSLYDATIPDMDPPSYSSVVAQGSSDWKNPSGSFSTCNNSPPYPLASSNINGGKSSSDLDNQAPYPLGPEPISQQPCPTGDCLTEGFLAMPMPATIKIERPIGFTDAVTSEPKSASLIVSSSAEGDGSTMTETVPGSINSSTKLIDPRTSDEGLGLSEKNTDRQKITPREYSKYSPRYAQEPIRQVQQWPKSPAEEEESCLACCLCCLELCQCCTELFVIVASDD